MSLRNFLIVLAASSFIASSAARGSDEKAAAAKVDPAAELLAKAVPDASLLPTADMAVIPSLQVLEDAIVITVKDEGYALAYLKPQKLSMKELLESKEVASAKDADELAKDLNNFLDRPLWDGSSPRDRNRLSKRHVFLVLRAGMTWQRASETLRCVVKDFATYAWFAAKDANGNVGALAAWLPFDRGGSEGERASFDVKLDRTKDASALETAEQLYGAAHAIRVRAGDVPMDCMIRPTMTGERIENVLSVVNECRRFGFRVNFAMASPEEHKDLDPATQLHFHFSPPVEVPADVPAKVPGRAVFGDPQKND